MRFRALWSWARVAIGETYFASLRSAILSDSADALVLKLPSRPGCVARERLLARQEVEAGRTPGLSGRRQSDHATLGGTYQLAW